MLCRPAGLGGITYWLTIFPVDCIKSAMQTDSIVKGQRKYTDVITTAKVSFMRRARMGESAVSRVCAVVEQERS